MPRGKSKTLAEKIRDFDVRKLTPATYFTTKNLAISPSKAKMFRQSKRLFADVMTGKREREKSDMMKAGSVFDALLCGMTAGKLPFSPDAPKDSDRYLVRSKYDAACRAALWLIGSPLFAAYRESKAEFQRLLTVGDPRFPVCGTADVVVQRAGRWHIDDFKLTNAHAMRSPRTFYWHAVSFGYFEQLGAYRWMLSRTVGVPADEIICRLVATAEDKDGVLSTKVYEMNDFDLTRGEETFLLTAEEIVATEDWTDPLPTWEGALPLEAQPSILDEIEE